MHLTLAFSAQEFVKDVGSYAGFAAVVALALFALLLFAQAREIKRLREWGGQAHDRIGELERSVASALDMARRAMARPAAPAPGPSPVQQARGPVARRPVGPAQPAAAAAAVGAGAGAARVASTQAPVRPQLLPSAPAGLAGPALASATMLIPLPGKPEAEPLAALAPARPARPAARPAAAAVSHAGAAAGGAVAGAAGAGATAVARDRADVADEDNGHHDDPPTEFPPPRRATPAAARATAGGPPRRGAAPAGRPARPGARPQAAPLRASGGGSRALPPQDEEQAPHGRRRLGAVLVSLLALIVVAGAVWFVAIRDTGSDTPPARVEAPDGAATRRAAARRTQTQRQQTPAPAHDSITVAVLNGTGITGLAGRVMGELTAAGYPQGGTVADAGTTSATATIVNYRDGRDAAAREVARTLGLPADAIDVIQPEIDQACAANSGGTCTADVVVVVGTDRQ